MVLAATAGTVAVALTLVIDLGLRTFGWLPTPWPTVVDVFVLVGAVGVLSAAWWVGETPVVRFAAASVSGKRADGLIEGASILILVILISCVLVPKPGPGAIGDSIRGGSGALLTRVLEPGARVPELPGGARAAMGDTQRARRDCEGATGQYAHLMEFGKIFRWRLCMEPRIDARMRPDLPPDSPLRWATRGEAALDIGEAVERQGDSAAEVGDQRHQSPDLQEWLVYDLGSDRRVPFFSSLATDGRGFDSARRTPAGDIRYGVALQDGGTGKGVVAPVLRTTLGSGRPAFFDDSPDSEPLDLLDARDLRRRPRQDLERAAWDVSYQADGAPRAATFARPGEWMSGPRSSLSWIVVRDVQRTPIGTWQMVGLWIVVLAVLLRGRSNGIALD
jgi:hypothetical protein